MEVIGPLNHILFSPIIQFPIFLPPYIRNLVGSTFQSPDRSNPTTNPPLFQNPPTFPFFHFSQTSSHRIVRTLRGMYVLPMVQNTAYFPYCRPRFPREPEIGNFDHEFRIEAEWGSKYEMNEKVEGFARRI